MDIRFWIALLPAIFMLHDLEEIIMFQPWLEKNRGELKRRFPRLDKVLQSQHYNLSTSAFAVAVLHEFVLVSLATFLPLAFNAYQVWFGAFAAVSLHFVAHIAQWIIYRKYVPVIVTSLLALPYCVYTSIAFLKVADLTAGQLLVWAALGAALALVSFVPAFFLAGRFEVWKNRRYLHTAD